MGYKSNPNLLPKIQSAVAEGVGAYLLTVGRAMREQLSVKGSGRIYRVAQPKRKRKARNFREAGYHYASSPGRPPAPDTGTLRRSWSVGNNPAGGVAGTEKRAAVVVMTKPGYYGLRYGSVLRYALIDTGYGNVKPRPYIAPTLDAIRDLFEPTMVTALRRALGGGN
jgi:hypothetical protein